MQSSAKLLQPSKPAAAAAALPPTQPTSSSSPPIVKQCCKLTRRELAIRTTNSSLLLLLACHHALEPMLQLPKAFAEETPEKADSCIGLSPTKRAFLEVSIDGEPAGRIIIGLNGDTTPAGTARFTSLVSGAAGISYRRKEFIKIMPNYIQHGGVKSYGVDSSLVDEWEKQYENCPGTKNVAGSVGLVVRDPSKPPPKIKLVARKGKLEIDQEEVGIDPNGTEFVISLKDSPELDGSALVVGRVLEGMDVVRRIGQVQTVRENTSSPYFRVAKLIGDKRAVVAERGFNRPYSKILITNCGLMD